MPEKIVAPMVKASIAASNIDLNGKLVCLIAALIRVIPKIAAINVAGAIRYGASSISSKIVLIMSISLKCIEILDFESKKEESSRVETCNSKLSFHEQPRI